MKEEIDLELLQIGGMGSAVQEILQNHIEGVLEGRHIRGRLVTLWTTFFYLQKPNKH